jgi:tRNA(Ile)-lysidine synthase
MGAHRRPALLRRLAAFLDAHREIEPGARMLVAVSGGPDSAALVLALAELAPARAIALTAAHVRHGLRGAAGDADADVADDLARQAGVPMVSSSVALRDGPGLEARARQARYDALEELADRTGATWIATGHTRHDQAETVLMRLVRGSGRRGLGGIRAVRGRIVRPMLDVGRTDVRVYLAARGVRPAVDATNADLRHLRNRVRRLVLPLLAQECNPRVVEHLAALADRLADEDDLLAAQAARRAVALGVGEQLPVTVGQEHPALARRIVRSWLEAPERPMPTDRHVRRVLALAGGSGRQTAVPGPGRVVREGDVLVWRSGREADPGEPFCESIAAGGVVSSRSGRWVLTLGKEEPPEATAPPPPRSSDRAVFDAERLPAPLVVRSPRPGDRIHLAQVGTRKVSDVLIDAKVPREARPHTPLLAAGETVLWVAGVARSSAAPVEATTRRVVEARLRSR